MIKIIQPTKEIFDLIDFYKELIAKALPKAKITLIGSFAIPMLSKEEFDLLVEVDDIKFAQKALESSSNGRFGIGPIEKGVGYCRSKKRYGIICEVHFVTKGHKKINSALKYVDKLRNNIELKKQFEEFKLSLDGKTEEEYKKEKSKFLKNHELIKVL